MISDDLHRLATLHIAPKAPLIIEQTTTLDHVFWSLRFGSRRTVYATTKPTPMASGSIGERSRGSKKVVKNCEMYQNAASSRRCGMLWQVKNIHKSSLAADVLNCFYIYISLYIIIYIYNYIYMFLMFHSKQLEGSRAIQEVDACHQHRLPRQVPLESTWSPPLSLALWAIPLRKSPTDSESHYMILLYNLTIRITL